MDDFNFPSSSLSEKLQKIEKYIAPDWDAKTKGKTWSYPFQVLKNICAIVRAKFHQVWHRCFHHEWITNNTAKELTLREINKISFPSPLIDTKKQNAKLTLIETQIKDVRQACNTLKEIGIDKEATECTERLNSLEAEWDVYKEHPRKLKTKKSPKLEAETIEIEVPSEVPRPIPTEPSQIDKAFKECTNRLVTEEMTFELAEELKALAKAARTVLKDASLPIETRQQLESVVSQYDQIVKSIKVLDILREMSREIRNPQMLTTSWGVEYASRPTFDRFNGLVGSKKDELAKLYQSDKAQWKTEWTAMRKRVWKASKAAESFLAQNKKITFITGSKSPTLPSVLKVHKLAPSLISKPALVPTGMLLRHHLVPLAGELRMGITDSGVNQRSLSGMGMAGIATCLGYASVKGCKFNADEEVEKIKGKKEIKYIFDVPSLRISVLRLLRMGAKTEEYEDLKKHIAVLIEQQPPSAPVLTSWKRQGALIGLEHEHVEIDPSYTLAGELQRGQVVAVPRTGFAKPKYGVVTKQEGGKYSVIVERDGTTKTLSRQYITVVPDGLLKERADLEDPLTEDEVINLERGILDLREALKEILNMFDTVKPFDFTKGDLELIEEPFPLVWASLTRGREAYVKFDIPGENLLKGPAILGEDIQLVFTSEENIPKLERLVNPHGVQVMGFDAALYVLGHDKDIHYKTVYD